MLTKGNLEICALPLPHTILFTFWTLYVTNLKKPNTWLNVIAVELQKAFDLINHNTKTSTTVKKKLTNDFLVDPYLIRIISSFLSNRTQVVKYLNVYSDLPPNL